MLSSLLPLFERTFLLSMDAFIESPINYFLALSFCGLSSLSLSKSNVKYYFSSYIFYGCNDLVFYFKTLVVGFIFSSCIIIDSDSSVSRGDCLYLCFDSSLERLARWAPAEMISCWRVISSVSSSGSCSMKEDS